AVDRQGCGAVRRVGAGVRGGRGAAGSGIRAAASVGGRPAGAAMVPGNRRCRRQALPDRGQEGGPHVRVRARWPAARQHRRPARFRAGRPRRAGRGRAGADRRTGARGSHHARRALPHACRPQPGGRARGVDRLRRRAGHPPAAARPLAAHSRRQAAVVVSAGAARDAGLRGRAGGLLPGRDRALARTPRRRGVRASGDRAGARPVHAAV
ncbi:MAG: hypothetical protein AVDCRST_MAG51-1518, partial [uncultured Ramlibacter sp.]